MPRTCLIVSPYFPPSKLAGVHRARHLAKHLPASGWTPIIVCVDELYHEEQLDPELAALVPASVQVVKVPALSKRLCRPLGLGDLSLRAWRPIRQAVHALLAERRIDAVLITGSPYYPMLMAKDIKRRHGVPVVLDFQDPWVSAWGAALPSWSKGGIAHRLAAALEPKALRAADFITSVSQRQNDELVERYPWLPSGRTEAIPIGGDPADYDALTSANQHAAFTLDRSRVNISYVGTIWPPVVETIRTLLKAVAEVRSRRTDIYARLTLNFIGTTDNPDTPDGTWLPSMAEDLGIDGAIREEPRRLPYLDALRLQSCSNAILLFGSTDPHYTASKIYGAMMSGRPYLSIFHELSSSHEILCRAGGGASFSFRSGQELLDLVSPIADALIRLVDEPETFGRANPESFRNFTASHIARQYAKIFERLPSRHAHSSTES